MHSGQSTLIHTNSFSDLSSTDFDSHTLRFPARYSESFIPQLYLILPISSNSPSLSFDYTSHTDFRIALSHSALQDLQQHFYTHLDTRLGFGNHMLDDSARTPMTADLKDTKDKMSEISQEDAAVKMSSTPSPTASNSASSTSASRRPPRKSTLTQQQKNQKRQRATQDQLVTLEMEFNKNPTPTATVRERIAEDINMTERSVQIWFQNR